MGGKDAMIAGHYSLLAALIFAFVAPLQLVLFKPHNSGFRSQSNGCPPSSNCIEIVSYENVQFAKAPNVLRGMGLAHLSKNEQAIKELTAKDMAPS